MLTEQQKLAEEECNFFFVKANEVLQEYLIAIAILDHELCSRLQQQHTVLVRQHKIATADYMALL